MGLFDIFKQGLRRSRAALQAAFGGPAAADTGELEAALLAADLGPELAFELAEKLRGLATPAELRAEARRHLTDRLCAAQAADGSLLASQPLARPEINLLVGVNGSGKTTTAGKLAAHFCARGERILLGAGDTFRAAAAEQLALWAERSGAGLLRQAEGADPAAVAFDSVSRAAAGGYDRAFIDTAGRLQTKTNLMEELRKVHRVCGKALAGAPHRVLLVLDGTSGQNMLSQVRLFREALPLDGLVVTKLDGSSRAGALLSVARESGIPVVLVGLGEGSGDLQDFNREAFVDALLP